MITFAPLVLIVVVTVYIVIIIGIFQLVNSLFGFFQLFLKKEVLYMINRILKLIKENGITAKKITSDLEISSSSISDWKKGKGKPSAETIIKLANYFNVSTDYILLGENKNTSIISKNDFEQKVLSTFRLLNEDNKDIIIGKMKELLKDQKQNEYINVAAKGGKIDKLPDSELIDKDIQKAKNTKINKI